MDELKQKLVSEIEEGDWSMLSPHYERDALFIVSPDLNLAEVGYALAEDDGESVKRWQENGEIRRPTPSDVSIWKEDQFKKFAKFLIIQPFVVIQEILDLH